MSFTEFLGTSKRVRRIVLEPQIREVLVSGVQPVSEGFVGVWFSGPALTGFSSPGFDDHVKIFFDTPAGVRVGRHYTVRGFDGHEGVVRIEFGLHGQGAAVAWARQVRPGQRVMIAGPRSSTVIPSDYGWHLLVGDATALPAIRRRLEELPSGSRVFVRALAAKADRLLPASAADVDLRWAEDAEQLEREVDALALPPGRGFVWGGGEACLMERLRAILLEQHRLPREDVRLTAYWKRGASDFHDSLASPLHTPPRGQSDASVPAGESVTEIFPQKNTNNMNNAIHWPSDYLPGTTDNFVSNETIVAGLSAADVWPLLSNPTRWPNYYANSANVRFYDNQGSELTNGRRFYFETFGFPVESQCNEFEPPREGKPGRVAWHGWAGEGDTRLDVHHAWLIEDLEGGRVRILTQETQKGVPAKELARARPNPMINGHQDWLDGLVAAARAAKR